VFESFKDWFHLHYQILKDFAAPSVALVGLVLTASVAIAGFRSFGQWKREKIEERRIDVALNALAIAYEARFRFEVIRSPVMFDGEGDYIAGSGEDASFVIRHREAQKGPYAVLKRMRDNSGFFDKVFDLEPKFMAVFGAETQAIFELLYEAKGAVEASANVLYEEGRIENDPSDTEIRERQRKLRMKVFASKGKIESEDSVGQKILEFQKQIEKLCRPIIDETFGRRGKKSKSPA
jgi:hypothetical protein